MTQTKTITTEREQRPGEHKEDTHMRAIVYHTYGSPDVLKLEEVQKPVPQDDEVLVQVLAASVNAGDWHLLRAKPFLMRLMGYGLLKPKHTILGSDIAGRVEAVGRNVTQFQVGDEVFGDLSGCGFGGFAEYVCARENALALKPANLSFEEAAAGYHAMSAYQRALSARGMYVMTGGSSGQMFQAMLLGAWISMTGSKKMGNLLKKSNQKDLALMKELLEASKVVPVIDRRYPL